jgi:hypothetical protein
MYQPVSYKPVILLAMLYFAGPEKQVTKNLIIIECGERKKTGDNDNGDGDREHQYYLRIVNECRISYKIMSDGIFHYG